MASSNVYDSSIHRWRALEELQEIFRYRYLIYQLVRRDVLTRYKRSVLGVAWTMLNPLGTMVILSIVFSRAFGAGREYAAYILSGLVVWLFFSQSTTGAMTHLLWGEGLVKRIYVPRTAFAVAAVILGLVNLVFSLVPLLLVMLVTGVPLRWTLLLVPLPIFFLLLFALGVALLISTLAVYFADIAEIYPVVLLAWMYLSPILYPKEYLNNFPTIGLWIARLNPMYHLIDLFRSLVYDGRLPDVTQVLIAGGIGLVTAALGWVLFTSHADELAYRL